MGNYSYLGQVYVPAAGTTNLYDFEGNGADLVGGASASLNGSLTFPAVPKAYHGIDWIQSAFPNISGSVGNVTFPNSNINVNQGTVELVFCTSSDVSDTQVIFASEGSTNYRALEFNIYAGEVVGIINNTSIFGGGTVLPNTVYYMALTWGAAGTSWYLGLIASNGSINMTLLFNTSIVPIWGTVTNVYMFQSFNSVSNFLGKIDWVRFSNVQRTSFPTVDVPLSPQPQAIFMGQDITAQVTQWDQIEQIKDVLLSDAQFVSSEINITVDNSSHFLSPQHPASMIQGRSTYNQSFQILISGTIVFNGLVQDIQLSPDDQSATIVADDLMGTLTNAIFVSPTTSWTTSQNPGSAMLAILEQVGLTKYLNQTSFFNVNGPSEAAGATIQYLFTSDSNTTALAAIQAIASLASISVFVLNNQIFAKVFQPYQGNGSGLSFPINDQIVRTWTQYDWDTESFNNQVTVPYGSGTGSPYTETNFQSVAQNMVTRGYQFDGSSVMANDQGSAQFFANSYLSRAAQRRGVLQFTGGLEFAQSVLGDRHWVTSTDFGLSNFPMEIIEMHRHLDTDDVDITMVALANTNEIQPILYMETWTEFLPGINISYLSGWTAFDTSPGLTGSGTVQYNLALGGQVARLIPANGYNYSVQYFGSVFQNIDLKFTAAMPVTSGASFRVLFGVQNAASYPANAYYFEIQEGAGSTASISLGQFYNGTAYQAVAASGVHYNPLDFSIEIISLGLNVTVSLTSSAGTSGLTFNFQGSLNPPIYTGGIGFAALGLTTGNYDITNITVSQPKPIF